MVTIARSFIFVQVIICLASSHDLCGQPIEDKQDVATARDEKSQLEEAKRLASEATGWRLAGKTAEALAATKQALEIREKLLGEEHADTAKLLSDAGFLLQAQGDYDAALGYYERCLAAFEKLQGKDGLDTGRAASGLGFVYYRKRNYTLAQPQLERSLAIFQKELGANHFETATAFCALGLLHVGRNDSKAARPYFEQGLAAYDKVLGNGNPITLPALDNLASLATKDSRYDVARGYYEKALAIREKMFGKEHLETAKTLGLLGKVFESLAKYDSACACLERALTIRKQKLGEEHTDTATSLIDLGDVLVKQGQRSAARPYLEQGLRIKQKLNGEESPTTTAALVALGRLHKAEGEYAAARTYFEQNLNIRRKASGAESSLTASALNDLGLVLMELGDYQAARSYLEQALSIRRKQSGENSPQTAIAHNNLGVLLSDLGELAIARLHYEQALAVQRKEFGENHASTARAYHNLAALQLKQGELDTAQAGIERSLSIRRKVLGEEHSDTALSLSFLASILERKHSYAAARACIERSLDIRRKTLGNEHPGLAAPLITLSGLCAQDGDPALAKKHLEEALAIRRRALGEKHPDTASCFVSMARLLKTEGNYRAAKKYYEQALDVRRSSFGTEHPSTVLNLHELAGLNCTLGDWSEAASLEDESRRGSRAYVSRVLPALAPKEQLGYLRQTDLPALHTSLSLGVYKSEDERFALLSGEWLLNGKAVSQVALAEQILLTRDAKDPALAGAVKQLGDVRRELANLALSVPKAEQQTAHRENIRALTAAEELLARDVAHRTKREADAQTWVELDAVRKQLPADGALIDIACIPVYDFAAKRSGPKWKPPHYIAWITTSAEGAATHVIDLGPAKPIDDSILAARKAIQHARSIEALLRREDEAAMEKRLRVEMQKITELVWQPLAAKVSGAKQLVISPDGLLWHLPFNALPIGGDKYLVEDFAVRYVLSGRDLIAPKSAESATGAPIIVVNPDYDLTAEGVRRALPDVMPAYRKTPLAEGPLRENGRIADFSLLPETAREANLVTPSLQKFTGAKPMKFASQYALEPVMKVVKRPSAVFMSTHGFFLADEDLKQPEEPLLSDLQTTGPTLDRQALQNPLLRCGLALAGCNSPQQLNVDDGILTGMEILSIDLRGTKLVVLSACDTGVGQVHNGEGVAGLRQAFQLAGANAVVASLWPVTVEDSARLTIDFLEQLAAGKDKAEALRQAELSLIAARRREHKAAHPYYWAPFTVTGR